MFCQIHFTVSAADPHRLSTLVKVLVVLCSPGFHYPLYGKTAGREESEVTPPSRGGAVSSKQSSDSASSSAMELLQQQSHQYHGKSPAVRLSLYCSSHTTQTHTPDAQKVEHNRSRDLNPPLSKSDTNASLTLTAAVPFNAQDIYNIL